ncbi:universal stress protein [Prescottella agglutinans]|uniref:universal stress protein n=1 Tax=Prescottella agglutinans TaxID=1644129 RepID=UPI003D95750D
MSASEAIVVAVDGSEAASNAVVWAARAAAVHQRRLHVVTAVHIPSAYHSDPFLTHSFEDELRDTARARIDSAQALARRTTEDVGSIEVTTEQIDGLPSRNLIELTKQAWMVVLGAHGYGEITGLAVGSVTAAVTAHAECPVAVVRGRTLDGLPPTQGPIVVGVDGSESCKPAVAAAFEEAAMRGTNLIAVFAWSDLSVQSFFATPSDDDLHWSSIQSGKEAVLADQLAELKEQYSNVVVQQVVVRDRPVRILSEYAEQAQLVVVGSRGHGGFKGMLLGSTSRALLHKADCPVLIVPSCRELRRR